MVTEWSGKISPVKKGGCQGKDEGGMGCSRMIHVRESGVGCVVGGRIRTLV
jgi:hypothetical protein